MSYKEMYFALANATENAIRILVDAQREAEELYISAEDPQVVVLRHPLDNKRISGDPDEEKP